MNNCACTGMWKSVDLPLCVCVCVWIAFARYDSIDDLSDAFARPSPVIDTRHFYLPGIFSPIHFQLFPEFQINGVHWVDNVWHLESLLSTQFLWLCQHNHTADHVTHEAVCHCVPVSFFFNSQVKPKGWSLISSRSKSSNIIAIGNNSLN